MSEHTSTNAGDALSDVDMEDMSDLAEALLAPAPPPVLNNEVYDDAKVTEDVTREEKGASRVQDQARDDTEEMVDNADDTSAEREATPNQQDRADAHDETVKVRLELLTSTFAKQVVELKHFASPPECAQYPEQFEEILGSFLDHATFTAKVWVNFDAAEGVFSEGARAADCGKLQIPRAKLDSLTDLDSNILNFRRIRFDIGTPFRTLAKIWFRVRAEGDRVLLRVTGKMVDQNPPLRSSLLHDFLLQRVQGLDNVGADQNLDMSDLICIAKSFRRRRGLDDEEDEWEKPRYGGGEWAGIEKPAFSRGTGWQD